MGLEGVLLGAHAEGIRNVLAVTGDPPHVGDYPGSRGVYEVDSIGLVQLLAGLNRGEDYVGKGLDAPTSFHIGVAVNPTADDPALELDRFHQKLEAGARFAMTQALFDLAPLDAFVERLGGAGRSRCSSASGRSAATRWRSGSTTRCRGSPCRTPCSPRCEAAGPDAPRVGLELARELVEGSRSRAAGIYVIPPFKQPAAALDLLAKRDSADAESRR